MKTADITRIATIADFKEGSILITSEGYKFRIMRKYSDGIWEARGTQGQGEKCVFEDEAKFYKVTA